MNTVQNEIRIVIPAYNSAATIIRCVDSILEATCSLKACHIIIVDNGKNPDLNILFKNYPIKIIQKREKASAAYSRNEGAKGFFSGIIVFMDCDVICEKDCIEKLIEPIQKNICDATVGNYSTKLEGLLFSQKYKQLYISNTYSGQNSPIKNEFWTAIAAVKADVFNKLQGFDTGFKGASGEDQEFGIRLTKDNYKVFAVVEATGQHIHPYTVKKVIKNDIRKGIKAVQNSMNYKVPLSDNRHAGKREMASVASSVLSLFFVSSSAFSSGLFYVALFCVGLWFICRFRLIIFFYKNGRIFFTVKSVLFMFFLDIIRFACVLIGITNNLLKIKKEEAVKLRPSYKYI